MVSCTWIYLFLHVSNNAIYYLTNNIGQLSFVDQLKKFEMNIWEKFLIYFLKIIWKTIYF